MPLKLKYRQLLICIWTFWTGPQPKGQLEKSLTVYKCTWHDTGQTSWPTASTLIFTFYVETEIALHSQYRDRLFEVGRVF